MNDHIVYLLISSISIYAMDTHRKDLYSTILKKSERNRSTYSTVHHLICGCEWTFLLALQTVLINCWKPLQTTWTQIRFNRTSSLIWIQSDLQSDSILEISFWKKKSADDKEHANLPRRQKSAKGIDHFNGKGWNLISHRTFTLALLCRLALYYSYSCHSNDNSLSIRISLFRPFDTRWFPPPDHF